jgi:hypothetical protein
LEKRDIDGLIMARVDVLSVDWVARAFPKEGFVGSGYLWGMRFWLLSAYRKVVGYIVPPIIEEA